MTLTYIRYNSSVEGFPGGISSKEPTCQCGRQETRLQSLDREDPLEKGMATHSSILAWRIPWTEEPGGLYSLQGCKESDTTEVTRHAHSSVEELTKHANLRTNLTVHALFPYLLKDL